MTPRERLRDKIRSILVYRYEVADDGTLDAIMAEIPELADPTPHDPPMGVPVDEKNNKQPDQDKHASFNERFMTAWMFVVKADHEPDGGISNSLTVKISGPGFTTPTDANHLRITITEEPS